MSGHAQYHPQHIPQPPPRLQLPARYPYAVGPSPTMRSTAPQQDPAPASPADDISDTTDHTNDSTPLPVTRIYDNKIWSLDVVQQPVRARMCGFGDKDRRPITPPPCIRLTVLDAATKKEVDINSLDTAYFVLTVDLWDVTANREVNLVAHAQSNAPSIGQVTPASFPHTVSNPSPQQPSPRPFHDLAQIPAYQRAEQNFEPPMSARQPESAASASSYYSQQSLRSYSNDAVSSAYPNHSTHPYPDQRNGYLDQRNNYSEQHNGYPEQHHGYPEHRNSYPEHRNDYQEQRTIYREQRDSHQNQRNGYPDHRVRDGEYRNGHSGQVNGYPQHHSSGSFSSQGGVQGYSQYASPQQETPTGVSDSRGAFTRNLIGSLSASAFKLTDLEEKFGIWFVLQDLSVRTEGWFRLKLNFVNVGIPVNSETPSTVNGQGSQTVTKGTAPVLASIFSRPFRVFSAKRFPGVIDSTDLSKLFANQGIKIPIRKDPVTTGGRRKGDDSGENEEEEC